MFFMFCEYLKEVGLYIVWVEYEFGFVNKKLVYEIVELLGWNNVVY